MTYHIKSPDEKHREKYRRWEDAEAIGIGSANFESDHIHRFQPDTKDPELESKTEEPTDTELTLEYEKEPYDLEEFISDFNLKTVYEEDTDAMEDETPKKFLQDGIYMLPDKIEILQSDASKKEAKAFCIKHKDFIVVSDQVEILFYLSSMPIRINYKDIILSDNSDIKNSDYPNGLNAYIITKINSSNLLIVQS